VPFDKFTSTTAHIPVFYIHDTPEKRMKIQNCYRTSPICRFSETLWFSWEGRTSNWIQYTHETIQVYYKIVKGVFNSVGQKLTNSIIWSL